MTAALVVAGALAACSSSGPSSTSDAPVSTPAAGTSALPAASGFPGVTVMGAFGAKPVITVAPGAAAATSLFSQDLVVGTGAVVAQGATVTADYAGVGLSSGKLFDASWDHQPPGPAQFSLAQVIAGWTQGVPGMQIGGRRLLVIPGALAYGANPPPGSPIAANETLVFVIDMVSSP